MDLYRTYCTSPLGPLQITCDGTHVNSILFMDDMGDATTSHPLLNECSRQLDEYFNGTRRSFTLPIQQTGTAFQLKVWELLLKLSFGESKTYASLAQQYGNIKSIRAVASANGKNKINIIVPCHRVIGTNGTLTGYSGGLWRKQWLLEHEAKHSGTLLFS